MCGQIAAAAAASMKEEKELSPREGICYFRKEMGGEEKREREREREMAGGKWKRETHLLC
jgi:hypothetical protein